MNLLFKDEVYAIVGAAFEVYNTLGPGFLEAVYHEALAIELAHREIPFETQHELRIEYKGRCLRKSYMSDFLCYGCIIVELKADNHLSTVDYAQVLNYLKAAGMTTGVLINFGSDTSLEWKRLVLGHRNLPRSHQPHPSQPIREDSRRFADQLLTPTGS